MEDYILIVDDQPAIRFLLQELFQEAGYQVKAVADGRECLRLVQGEKPPNLILLDHQMPMLTGLQVLETLKKEKATQGIPVIMLTGNLEIVAEAKEQGAEEVVVKPPDPGRLIDLVAHTLAKKKPGSFSSHEAIV